METPAQVRARGCISADGRHDYTCIANLHIVFYDSTVKYQLRIKGSFILP